MKEKTCLVHALERRDGLALVLIQGMVDDPTVLDVNFGLGWVVQPGESMLHPFLIVTLIDESVRCRHRNRGKSG